MATFNSSTSTYLHFSDKKQEEFSSVSTIEGNDDFTKAIKSRNLFSYQTNDNVEQGLGSQYKVMFGYKYMGGFGVGVERGVH